MPDSYVDAVAGESLVFKFEEAAAPGTYTESASINTDRSVDFSSDISASVRPNLTDRSKPGRMKRRVKSVDLRFEGAGISSIAGSLKLVQLQMSGATVKGKLIQDVTGGWTITGSWVIESIKLGGAKGDDQTFSISLAIADPDYTMTTP